MNWAEAFSLLCLLVFSYRLGMPKHYAIVDNNGNYEVHRTRTYRGAQRWMRNNTYTGRCYVEYVV